MSATKLETVTAEDLKVGDRIVYTYTHGDGIKVRVTGTVDSFTANFIRLNDIKREAKHNNFTDVMHREHLNIHHSNNPTGHTDTLIRRYPRKAA